MDLVSALQTLALPNTFGAPAIPLQSGQTMQAVVLALLENGAFRLQLPNIVLDVRAQVPLPVGSTVKLAVRGSGSNARLVIIPDAALLAGLDETARQAVGGRTEIPVALADPAQRAALGEAAQAERHAAAETSTGVRRVADAPALAPKPEARATPALALAQAVRSAAARQDGLAPLMANLEAAVGGRQLPEPVRAAAAEVLALRVPLDANVEAADIRQAMARSGTFLEQYLGQAGGPRTAPDLKAALLVLRHVLAGWAPEVRATRAQPTPSPEPFHVADLARALANPALPSLAADQLEALQALAKSEPAPPLNPAAHSEREPATRPPPPYRAARLVAQQPALPSIEPAAPHETAERLVAQTDAALGRITLLQAASLPDRPEDVQSPRWTFEVPFATPQGTAIAQFEVSRDGRAAPSEAHTPVWRAGFSLDLEPMGPVHALVTLVGTRTGVTLWAERASTVSQLNNGIAMLGDALRAAELEPGDIQFRLGTPRVAKPAQPGQFMDRAT